MEFSCPKCGKQHIIFNGFNGSNKQRYKCKDYGKQFVENPGRPKISEEKKRNNQTVAS
jgi:transposase-like protein